MEPQTAIAFDVLDASPFLAVHITKRSDGTGKTGLTYSTSGLKIGVWTPGGTWLASLENLTTPGTYEAPSNLLALRFGAADATNLPGVYEIHLPAAFVAGVNKYLLTIYDSSGSLDLERTCQWIYGGGVPAGAVNGSVPIAGVGPLPVTDAGPNTITCSYLAGSGINDSIINRLILDNTGLALGAIVAVDDSTGTFTIWDIASTDGDWIVEPPIGGNFYISTNYYVWRSLDRTLTVDPLDAAVPGGYASGSAGAALGKLGPANVVLTSPVATDQTVRIVQGDDYYAADGRSIDFSSTTCPDLTDATPTLAVDDGGDGLEVEGTVVNPGAATQSVRFELSAAQTAALRQGRYSYDVSAALAGGHVATIVSGSMIIRPPIAAG